MTDRKIVIPGEVISSGDDYLPGEGTERRGKEIVSIKFGLAEESNKLIKVIPLSGVYIPRRGNVVIGKVENVTFNGWVIDINTADGAFLSLMEVPRYVNKDDLKEVMDIGDMAVAKIYSINKRGIDLTFKLKGLGKLEGGMIININPNKVPRIIGKEGSMVSLIKDETGCQITVGQNGLIWIKGNKIEDELFAKKAILYIAEHSLMTGLTDEMKNWFDKEKKK
ncbi:MAG: exosome complex RNA-binding protein Rrp4 [Candidatus Nanoarchaeia archaeon]|nr:exosome complex RNA-binding protein Rrp4 [Candidatus Nanoarchaeia archaeon]MDD5357651.1 exosome complex RNA-binding protein Rrp4 [Candidatus Nanoarchaeia archaeon]MDD5588570.1 exosome complex RNA-binding protein Rrp4 [Candidatus Nanoarchaeia archaeon]